MNEEKIRVLVVDDSVVIRRLLCDVLSSAEGIEVVGTAADGRIALAKIQQQGPHVVTLDIEMPNLNGLETLKEIRKSRPDLRVIMFSTLTERGATATLDALALGADDYVAKPSNVGNFSLGAQQIREQLVPKIRALFSRRRVAPSRALAQHAQSPNPICRRKFGTPQQVEIVAMGTSTGGPNALAAVIPLLPRDFPVPVLVVQHMPPTFTRMLAQRLSAASQLAVREAEPGQLVEPGTVWVAPGDFHMTITQDGTSIRLVTHQNAPENSCRPAVDVLFRGAAEVYGSGVLAVIMTGMGQDGLRGCEHVSAAGGQIVIQDESTSVVWGMPGFVAKAGLADKVLPLDEIAEEIHRRVRVGTPRPAFGNAR